LSPPGVFRPQLIRRTCIRRSTSEAGTLNAKLATYLKPEDVGRVEAAYHFSADAHAGQFRVSGEPYISPSAGGVRKTCRAGTSMRRP
jgi:hypothetical protein